MAYADAARGLCVTNASSENITRGVLKENNNKDEQLSLHNAESRTTLTDIMSTHRKKSLLCFITTTHAELTLFTH